jgi:hypothetical protein
VLHGAHTGALRQVNWAEPKPAYACQSLTLRQTGCSAKLNECIVFAVTGQRYPSPWVDRFTSALFFSYIEKVHAAKNRPDKWVTGKILILNNLTPAFTEATDLERFRT